MYPGPEHPYYGVFVRDHVEALRARGHHIDVLFTDGRTRRSAYVRDVPRLAAKIRTGRYDLIHAHHTYSVLQAVAARRLARRRIPVVFTIHEGEVHKPRGLRDEGEDLVGRVKYSSRLKRRALGAADVVVAVERRIPGAAGHDGPYEVIPPGVDLERFRPMDRDRCREELGLPIGETLVFFPASPSRGRLKGFEVMEEAMRRLALPMPVRLITGGAIPPEDMPRYLNASDLVVLTSRFEASPMAVKEAMACNRPMVCTDVGDVAELFAGTPGYALCEPEPADVARAMTTALLRGGPAEGRRRIEELGLSLRETAERYEDLYERCAAGTAHATRGRRPTHASEGAR
jgi:glycosyltransferase involved in cell wall biosynthesis